MTHSTLSESAIPPAGPLRGDVPGLRTFRSERFRIVLALVLLVIGSTLVGLLLVRQAGAADGQFAIDFGDYYVAAERLSAGESPYSPEMLAGPTAAQGTDRYRYPPLFAQVLQPLAVALTLAGASIAWLLLQAVAVVVALWCGTGFGGAPVSVERALWCGVAASYFLPVFDTLWKGNVSGMLALAVVLVAMGGVVAGAAAAGATLLKAVPGTLVPAALVSDSRSRRSVLLVLAVGVGIGFVLAPGAWLEYPRVVANMLGGSTDYANNLAPAAVAASLGAPEPLATLIRVAALASAAAAVAGSAWLARTREGLPAAALLGAIALLLIPGSLWYHYLVVLLPFAAIAWPLATTTVRVVLFSSAALVTVGLAWLPLALLGATLLATVSLIVIRPRPTVRGWGRSTAGAAA